LIIKTVRTSRNQQALKVKVKRNNHTPPPRTYKTFNKQESYIITKTPRTIPKRALIRLWFFSVP